MDSMNLVSYIEDERLFDYAASCAQTLRPDALLDGRGEASTLRRCFQEIERCHSLFRRRYADAARIPCGGPDSDAESAVPVHDRKIFQVVFSDDLVLDAVQNGLFRR